MGWWRQAKHLAVRIKTGLARVEGEEEARDSSPVNSLYKPIPLLPKNVRAPIKSMKIWAKTAVIATGHSKRLVWLGA